MLLVILPPGGPSRPRLLFLDEPPYTLPPGCVATGEVSLIRYPPGGPPTGVFLEPAAGERRVADD